MSDIEFKRAKEGILKIISKYSNMTKEDKAEYLELKDAILAIETFLPKLKLTPDKKLEILFILNTYGKKVKRKSPYAKNDEAILSEHSKFLNNFAEEIEKIKITDTTIVENKMTWEDALDQEITVVMQKEPSLKIKIVSPVSMKDLLDFKKNILKAIGGIKASPIPNFDKALKGNLILGTDADIKEQIGFTTSPPVPVAQYDDVGTNNIMYFIDATIKRSRDIYITLIHEFAHRYHHKHIKGGFENPEIRTLFQQAVKNEEQCFLDQLPKIGDPLSNLRENWWGVKMSTNDEWILYKITDDYYIYKNSKGRLEAFDKKDILLRITCPSVYATKNRVEFFAEMVTLITLGLVKPSQKLIADKFMEIINNEVI
jgi:hypothetical protein